MIKLGILDFDSSHCVEFTKRLNHLNIAEEQWVDGAKVLYGWPGTSQISPERIAGYTAEMQKLGVQLVEKPTDMLGKVDGILVESVDGSVHWERAKPFLEAGIPCFIDKPFACSHTDAVAMMAAATKKNLPLFTSSSLRYAPELTTFLADPKHGAILSAFVYGPAPTHPRNPGLFHYGIHPTEILFTLMGPGCSQVTCAHHADQEIVTGTWRDGRIASLRGIRKGPAPYGALVFTEKAGPVPLSFGTKFIYRELLKQVVAMFQTGKTPLAPEISLEIVDFILAALNSANNHSTPQMLKS